MLVVSESWMGVGVDGYVDLDGEKGHVVCKKLSKIISSICI
jgi:hypothetical protein